MGIDLKLIITTSPEYLKEYKPEYWLAQAVIDCNRNYDFFDKINELEHEFKPLSVTIHASIGIKYKAYKNDRYGKPLMYITAGKLAEHFKDVTLDDWPNDAALAYIRALPADLPVVLYWH